MMTDRDTTTLANNASTFPAASIPVGDMDAPPLVDLHALRHLRAKPEKSAAEAFFGALWAAVTYSRQLSILSLQMGVDFLRLLIAQFVSLYRVNDFQHPFAETECKLWGSCPEISGPKAIAPTNPTAARLLLNKNNGTVVPSGPVTCPSLTGYFSWMRMIVLFTMVCFVAAAVTAGKFVRDGRTDIIAKLYVLMVAMTAGVGMVLLDSLEEAMRHDPVCSHTTLAEAGYEFAAAEGIDFVLAPMTFVTVLVHMVIAVRAHHQTAAQTEAASLEMADVAAQNA